MGLEGFELFGSCGDQAVEAAQARHDIVLFGEGREQNWHVRNHSHTNGINGVLSAYSRDALSELLGEIEVKKLSTYVIRKIENTIYSLMKVEFSAYVMKILANANTIS